MLRGVASKLRMGWPSLTSTFRHDKPLARPTSTYFTSIYNFIADYADGTDLSPIRSICAICGSIFIFFALVSSFLVLNGGISG